jgi:hypothetical protein
MAVTGTLPGTDGAKRLIDVAAGRVEIPAWAIHAILFSCAVIFVPLNVLTSVTSANRFLGFAAQVKTIFLLLIL